MYVRLYVTVSRVAREIRIIRSDSGFKDLACVKGLSELRCSSNGRGKLTHDVGGGDCGECDDPRYGRASCI